MLSLKTLIIMPIAKYHLRHSVDAQSPFCIIGPARSGTTLAHQCLVARFQLGYLPRFVSLFPRNSLLAASIWQLVNQKRSKTNHFKSHYGKGKGLAGIHQGHTIWRRWFKWDKPNAPLSAKERETFKKTIFGLGKSLGTPFSFKWPGFAAHFQELSICLPKAFFVIIDRDTLPLAKSIYKGRVDLHGTPNQAISRSPDGSHLNPGTDPISDILSYIFAVRLELLKTMNTMDSNRYCVIKYEELCSSPTAVIESVGRAYEKWSKNQLSNGSPLPKAFKVANGPDLRQEVETKIKEEYAKSPHKYKNSINSTISETLRND
jgi:hypothetical protein